MGPPPRPDRKLQRGDATNCDVRVRQYSDGTVFHVKIVPDSQYPEKISWDDIKYEYGVRVRLVLDGVDADSEAGENARKPAPKLITHPARVGGEPAWIRFLRDRHLGIAKAATIWTRWGHLASGTRRRSSSKKYSSITTS